MIEREGDIAPSHRQPLHRIEAGCIFGARAAQEFAPSRHLVEQALDTDAGARRECGWSLSHRLAMVDLIRQPSEPRTRLSSVSRETLAIDGNASPRKPKLVDLIDRVARAAWTLRAVRAPGAFRRRSCRIRRRRLRSAPARPPPAESRRSSLRRRARFPQVLSTH